MSTLSFSGDSINSHSGVSSKANECLSQKLRLVSPRTGTRLQFALPEGQALELQVRSETHALRGEGERLVDAPASPHLPGCGRLVIAPGGDDLVALARAHADARDALRAVLRGCGVDDIAEARSRLGTSTDLNAQIKLT